jgi:hypothetical protein
VLAAACAGPVTLDGARWRAREGGASVDDLARLEPGWRREAGTGALLAFRHADGARAGWLRQCRGASAGARPEAHALLVRFAAAEVEREAAVSLDGRPAWSLVASARDGGRDVTLKTVTRVSARACTDDFVLVAHDLAAREAAFDLWWASFEDGEPG